MIKVFGQQPNIIRQKSNIAGASFVSVVQDVCAKNTSIIRITLSPPSTRRVLWNQQPCRRLPSISGATWHPSTNRDRRLAWPAAITTRPASHYHEWRTAPFQIRWEISGNTMRRGCSWNAKYRLALNPSLPWSIETTSSGLAQDTRMPTALTANLCRPWPVMICNWWSTARHHS